MKRLILALFLFASSWFASPAQAVVLGISGTQFTFDGTPTFLSCTSYFDGTNYKISDLNYFANKGVNCIRVFASWPYATGGPSLLYDVGADDGSLNTTIADLIANLIDAANALGMVVDLTLSYSGLAADLETQGKRETFITNAINRYKTKTNVFYDAINEHSVATWSDSHAEMAIYLAAARAACATCLLSVSSGGDHIITQTSIDGFGNVTSDETLVTTNLDEEATNSNVNFLLPHLPRTTDWDTKTASRIATIRTRLSALGKNFPIVLDEEQRVGWNGAPVAPANFLLAAQLAKSAGAAGWLFHTDAAYDLAGANTYIGNLTADELTVVNGLSAALVPSVSPISVSAVCSKVHVDAGLSVSCTLPQAPVAGDVVLVTANVGQFDGVQPCTGGVGNNGVRDSQNSFFDLAVMSAIQTTNSSYIWYRPIAVSPSGSYSVTMTCPVASYLTMSAAIVKGLIPSAGMVDVVGFNSAPAGAGITVAGSTAMTQANELIVAVETHDTGGAGTAITETSGFSIFHEQETCSPSFAGHECGSSVYQITTLPQTVTHSWSMAASVNALSAAVASFRGITGNVGTINRTLTWTDNSSNETSFTVQKRTDQTYPTWVDVATGLAPNTQNYLATILATETGDCWRVATVNPYGTALSVNPSEFCVATAPPPPPPPPPALQIGGLQTLIDDELL